MGAGQDPRDAIRRLLLPEARNGLATGLVLGMGRIEGDAAIVLLLLGGTLGFENGSGWWHPSNALGTLRGTGTTLTAYIYNTSPAGELPSIIPSRTAPLSF